MRDQTDPHQHWQIADAFGSSTDDGHVIREALLAIAGELRTANLIAYWTASEDGTFSRMLSSAPASDIRDRLGIQ